MHDRGRRSTDRAARGAARPRTASPAAEGRDAPADHDGGSEPAVVRGGGQPTDRDGCERVEQPSGQPRDGETVPSIPQTLEELPPSPGQPQRAGSEQVHPVPAHRDGRGAGRAQPRSTADRLVSDGQPERRITGRWLDSHSSRTCPSTATLSPPWSSHTSMRVQSGACENAVDPRRDGSVLSGRPDDQRVALLPAHQIPRLEVAGVREDPRGTGLPDAGRTDGPLEVERSSVGHPLEPAGRVDPTVAAIPTSAKVSSPWG